MPVTMRSSIAAAVIAASVLAASAPGFAQTSAGADPTTSLLAQLHTVARCPSSTSPDRVWCIPADGFASGTAAALPTGNATLLGLTLELATGGSVADALSQHVSLSALALHHDGANVVGTIRTITPDNAEESRELATAVAAVASVFKGLASQASIDGGLATYLASLPAQATHPIQRGAHEWRLSAADTTLIRRVGSFWVAIEVPAARNGIFVSVFTDRYGVRH